MGQDPLRVSIARLFTLPREAELGRAEIEEILRNKALARELRAQLKEALRG